MLITVSAKPHLRVGLLTARTVNPMTVLLIAIERVSREPITVITPEEDKALSRWLVENNLSGCDLAIVLDKVVVDGAPVELISTLAKKIQQSSLDYLCIDIKPTPVSIDELVRVIKCKREVTVFPIESERSRRMPRWLRNIVGPRVSNQHFEPRKARRSNHRAFSFSNFSRRST